MKRICYFNNEFHELHEFGCALLVRSIVAGDE